MLIMKHSYMKQNLNDLPRGMRNNNPLNIRHTYVYWRGEVSEPNAIFCRFKSNIYGLRAGLKLIFNYNQLYGINTLERLIARWAPSCENSTEDYINVVSASSGVPRSEPLTYTKEEIKAIMKSMIIVECGYLYRGFDDDFDVVWNMFDLTPLEGGVAYVESVEDSEAPF